MKKLALIATLTFAVLVSTGCVEPSHVARDKCYDAQSYLWNPKIQDNRYKGNEAYWDATTQCDNKYPT